MAGLFNINNNRVLFIHIPKTGGTSIINSLQEYAIEIPSIIGHPSYKDCNIEYLKPDLVFTVVRNPWDWRSSWYHYLKKDVNADLSGHKFEVDVVKNQGFKKHIEWLSSEKENNFTKSFYNGNQYNLFLKSQSSYIIGCNDLTILKFENLKSDFETYMKKIGGKAKLDVRLNASKNSNYLKHYDAKTASIIKNMYSDDITNFDYSNMIPKFINPQK